jgi:fructose-1,6-bisphosphatase/inositol monophosphatase family enzyme
VHEALGLALGKRGEGEVHVKRGRDIVTDADVAVEDLIGKRLQPHEGGVVCARQGNHRATSGVSRA